MKFTRLDDWLAWQESLNPAEIDLGLDRVRKVLTQAGWSSSFNCPLITVAGTNGKGSVVAMLEAMAMAMGLNVCSYTSPHLFKYNERIKINARPVDDNTLCEAFERVDQARAEQPLTYFEFGTLAAIDLFFRQQPDLVILEVGLGGRLDAVNVMDADVSVLTSVAIDHVDWLGDSRESIGYEKAGIFRAQKPVVCGDYHVPDSVIKQAEKLRCEFYRLGHHYAVANDSSEAKVECRWTLRSPFADLSGLLPPSLVGEFQKTNAATAIVALQTLQQKALLGDHVLNAQVISKALSHMQLPGRFQKINLQPEVYVDVAHNPQAAQALAAQIESARLKTAQLKTASKTWAIVSMLSDKDINGVLTALTAEIDCWCFAGLENINRGLAVTTLLASVPASILPAVDRPGSALTDESSKESDENQCTILSATVMQADTVTKACECVLSRSNKNDRIIIFGSFYTVAEAMQFFSELNNTAALVD